MFTNHHPASSSETTTARFEAGLAQILNNPTLHWLRQHALALITVPLVATVSFVALSQSTAPSIPAIALSADPLYTATGGDKPALALALSVEFPTVGAQYLDPVNNTGGATTDPSYSNVTEYLGYYDAESCYSYNKAPTETPVSPQTINDFKRFDRSGAASSRKCTGETFSGNFLNWASSSAMDMLRLSLTGGDRYIDTPAMTILQRAVLPHDGNGFPSGYANFWNSTNFPGKQLKRGTVAPYYFGAVPASMATAAGTNDVWIVNDLNKIYFGTSKVGSTSASSTSYTLGTPVAQVLSPPVSSNLSSKPSGFSTTTSSGSNISNSSATGLIEVVIKDTSNNYDRYVVYGSVTCNSTNFPSLNGSCYTNGTDFSPTTTYPIPTSPSSLTNDSFFYARVQVCDRDPTTYALKDVRDYGLCKTYSDGASPAHASYKPTGAIQKYSDQLRLAAFGYLMDQVDTRVGGVLRAPIKYVGAKTFDTNGVDNTPSGGNPNQEWNQTTGQFITNPDGNASVLSSSGSYLSGVITYVNQFGRTGAVPGRYKIYDPLSELHYEALRYLQGLTPSASAISGLTTDMYDGFPVATTWTDPYGGSRSNTADYSCLKSNIVMIGDKNTNERSGSGSGSSRLPTANAANNLPDIGAWSTVVQNFEKNVTSTYLDGQGVSRTTSNPNGANSAVPTGLQSLIMGSAYWARTHDIRGAGWTGTGGPALQRPGLRVKTFMFDVNEFSGSTNNTTRRTSNQLFMTAKYGGFETDPSNTAKNPYNTKGNPFYRDDMTTADNYVWADMDPRTSRVGEANTYFLQSDARGVLSAFDDIFSRASTAARSIAGGAIQSKNLTQAGDTIYQGTFDTSDWSGDLLAIPVTVSTTNVVAISNTTAWTAATQLAAMSTPATSRNIVVGKVGATANPVATTFTWAAIEAGLQSNLNNATPASTSDSLGQDRLNYLRGDRSKEGSPFRIRNKLLGDIINSGVVYSGAPTTSISSSTFASFASTNAARTPAVFVGANDGMLHAFNASNGNELFAYIPSWLGSKLSALTSTGYVNAHQSYVDGTPAVAEAQVGSAGTASDWKTVLVGGTGAGGQGVFALDVTDPSTFGASNVMWEFTHADDQDMGNVTGRPQILKLRTSAYNATTATYKWFAVVGSGVNNYVTDSAGLFSSTGNPALFLLDLNKQVGDAWTLGTNYYKISLPVDSTLSASKATGLINFRAALGAAREVTQIYMGDLHGNLWKLDFSLSLGSTEWNIGKLSSFNKGTSSSPIPYPLFIAKDGSNNVQPITMAPSIAFGPEANTSYVFFGTGKYYETSDKGTTATQSEYMVFDDGSSSGDSSPVGASAISGRLRLKQGTANATTGVISTPAFTPGRATTTLNTEVIRSGWYADLPTSGERQISNATVFGTNVVFGSLIPGATGSSSCAAAGGGGNQYTVDIASGNGNAVGSGVGILGEPLVSEISGATTYTPTDSTGRRTKTVTSQIFQQGSSGVSVGRTSTITLVAGRLSWRQINNYQDLKNAP